MPNVNLPAHQPAPAGHPFYTDEHHAFRDMVERFVDTEITPHAGAWDEAEEFPRELHQKAGALGLYGLGIDEDMGGLGFDDAIMRSILWQGIARCGAGGVGAGLFTCYIATKPIQDMASPELKARILPPVMTGEKLLALAVTEPSGGSDVANLKTRAVQGKGGAGDDFIVNGSKTFISSGMRSDFYLTAVRTGGDGAGGVSLLVIDRDTPGFTQTPLKKMGWWCSDTATLYFDECRVPAANLVGPEGLGFAAIMDNFNYERLGLTAMTNGFSKLCVEEATRYARERETFGKPLIANQVIRHKIVEMDSRVNAVQAWLDQLCWRVNQGEMPVAEISQIKAYATVALEYCAREAVQIFGGAGFLRGTMVERIYREVRVMAIGGGSEEVMRDLAARQMGL